MKRTTRRPLDGTRRLRRLGARAALPLATLAVALPASPALAARTCAAPEQGREWSLAAAPEVGLDAALVQQALDAASADGRAALAVYRHGCLIATDSGGASTREQRYESWSVAKTVVSLAAGRAMTLGLLSPDDRVGGLIPEADAAHGKITLRQLLEMASGLHWNFVRDYAAGRAVNRVDDALTLPLDHKPGSHFEYAQSAVALTAEMIERAARTDFQQFVQRELFGPIGIASGSWSWTRDAHGNTLGYMGLQLLPRDYARLGQLMLDRGVWRGRRLLADAYVTAATRPSAANHGYGWFWWVNGGDRFIGPTVEARTVVNGPFVSSAPADMFSAVGFGDQLIMVIPSLDLVLTRSAPRSTDSGDRDPTGSAQLRHELVRSLMRAVDGHPVPDPGPFRQDIISSDTSVGIRPSLTEREHIAASRQTPPLPPAGPALARAVRIGRSFLHVEPMTVRVGDGGAPRIALTCPPAGRRNCTGTASLTRGSRRVAKQIRFDIRRGKQARLPLALTSQTSRRIADGATVKAKLSVRSATTAGKTSTTTTATLRAVRAR